MMNISTICLDCFEYLRTGDATFLDFYYEEEESTKILNDIKNGLLEMDMISETVDIININEFSISPCECCGTRLAGERYEIEYEVKS